MAIRHILLDTNAYTAFKRGIPTACEIIEHVPFIGLSAIMLGELYGGFAFGTQEQRNLDEFERFLTSRRVHILDANADTARHYAAVYRELRQKGRPIPTNDIWLAATARQYDLALFSYDAHFQAIDDLHIGNTLRDFLFS